MGPGDEVSSRRRTPIEAIAPLLTADRAAFSQLIDYSGLLPPVSLTMERAVADYRRARTGPHSWLLGRFMCPASRLEQLAGILMTSMHVAEQGGRQILSRPDVP